MVGFGVGQAAVYVREVVEGLAATDGQGVYHATTTGPF